LPKVLIWDSNDEPPQTNEGDLTICWKGYRLFEEKSITSVLLLVENNAAELRHAYLTWIQNIGDCLIEGKSIVNHLNIRKDFSFWWTTLISEKSNFSKSPQIDDIIRIIAVNKFVYDSSVFDSIEVVSDKKSLASYFKNFAAEKKIKFHWKKRNSVQKNGPKFRLRSLVFRLPRLFQALIWLGHYLYINWSFRGVGLSKWSSSQANVTFISYFFNIDKNKTHNGIFKSDYWGSLPEFISEVGRKTNWLHIFVRDKNFSDAAEVTDALKRLNGVDGSHQNHIVLECFLSLKIVARAICDWVVVIFHAKTILHRVRNEKSNILLWPLIQDDWSESFFGISSIRNIMMFNLFEEAFSKLSTQKQGFFLLENQGWEMAMSAAWRGCRHQSLIGCPHSTVRFWDLRHFFDDRIFNCPPGVNSPPLADKVAVNGPVARAAFLDSGYPLDRLVEVEALRYLYLANNERFRKKTDGARSLRLLVVGDYVAKHTHRQMTLLCQLDLAFLSSLSIIVKPHPATPINSDLYRSLNFVQSDLNISELLASADIVFASALTSAAVDAFCSVLPVIVSLDPDSLNLSPLRSCSGVRFISSSKELGEALSDLEQTKDSPYKSENFFYVDNNLHRWCELLSL